MRQWRRMNTCQLISLRFYAQRLTRHCALTSTCSVVSWNMRTTKRLLSGVKLSPIVVIDVRTQLVLQVTSRQSTARHYHWSYDRISTELTAKTDVYRLRFAVFVPINCSLWRPRCIFYRHRHKISSLEILSEIFTEKTLRDVITDPVS